MKCLTCRHCVIDGGSPAYSDVTPGDIADAFSIGETCDQWEDDGRKGRAP